MIQQRYRDDAVRVYPARDALKRESDNLVVPEGQTITFTPSDRGLAHYFARVELAAFDDLQILGFVPRKLPEQEVRRAIQMDDDEAYKMSASAVASFGTPCGCESRAAVTARTGQYETFQIRFRKAYREVRRANNPALARLLSDHYGVQIPFNDPLPTIVRNWISYFDVTARFGPPILISVLQDVTIHRGGALTTDPGLKSFLARNIWIHKTGQLVQRGSYLKIWAHAISGFWDFQEIVTAAGLEPSWKLGL
jgi:hypothetical protein